MSICEPVRIFALRHGQTDWNAEQRIQGQLDVPLNGVGRWQAARLAQALSDESLAAIYSSDLQRAGQTAGALADGRGCPVQHDVELRERGFGSFEGHTWSEIEQRWPDDSMRWRRREPEFSPGGGETLKVFHARCLAAVHRLAAPHAGQTIAIVAHGGVLDCLYRASRGIELQAPRTWQLGNAAINRLLWTSEQMTVVGWNDIGHLESGAPD